MTELEKKLVESDEASLVEDTAWQFQHSMENGEQSDKRKALVAEIEAKLLEYDELLLHHEEMRKFSRPSERTHRNFLDYIYTKPSVSENEEQFIFHGDDEFVTLQQYEENWLDQFLQRSKSTFSKVCRKSFPKIPQGRFRENRKKVLRVRIKGKDHLSCPDSGSSENIMSEEFSHNEGFRVRRDPEDLKRFQLGSGKFVWSIGRVHASVSVPGLPLASKKGYFFVLPNCPVPLIMGLSFLQEAEIMSKNRHILESCPAEWRNISNLLWIGFPRPRNRMKCSLDGHNLTGVADTGSDLNFMSLECAQREGFDIDRREMSRRRIKFGDGTEAETAGQVYVYNLGFDWSQPETELQETASLSCDPSTSTESHTEEGDEHDYEIFHVLPGLPTDLIFGRDLLERLDAFNRCPELSFDEHLDEPNDVSIPEFNVLIDMGGFFSSRRRRRNKKKTLTPSDEKEKHDDERHAELGRRSRIEDEISLLPQGEQAQARRVERRKARTWDQLHAHCVHCNPV